jgi:hypothetical protein
MTALATYQVFIDWDNDGGLNIGDFESGFDGWVTDSGSVPTLDNAHSHLGKKSLKVVWGAYNPFQFDVAGKGFNDGTFGGSASGVTSTSFKFGTAGQGFDQGLFSSSDIFDPTVSQPFASLNFSGLVIGRTYTYQGWVYVPSSSGSHVQLYVLGNGYSAASSLTDQWQQLQLSFTATATTHTLEVVPANGTDGVKQTWIDHMMVIGPGEDITSRVLGTRQSLGLRYGRDQGRALSAITPGQTDMEVDNRSRDYSPDNPGSVIAGYLSPGKPVLIQSTYAGMATTLFNGFLDDYQIMPDPSTRSVKFTILDVLGRLAKVNLHTALYPSLQTGQAIHVILDALGWPTTARDIDPGATTCAWWWEEGTDGLTAVQNLVKSEGLPAFAFVDSSGKFVFRDRHHRILRSASLTSQVTFRDNYTEPTFCSPFTYNIGWKELINSMDVDVNIRQPGEVANIYESEDTLIIATGQTMKITVVASDPFMNAITPVQGTDYTVNSGSVSVAISRTSGQTLDVLITGVSAAVITGLNVRATPVPVARTVQIHVEDPVSIAKYDVQFGTEDLEMPWVGVNDALAIATIIIGQRGERLPIITFTVNNGNATRLMGAIQRDLSDRIHIVETETFTDHDYFIEVIEHDIADIGYQHKTTFGCERVRTQVSPLFTFDVAASGFDRGLFGLSGLDDPATVMVLDVDQLDVNVLGT